MKTLNHYIFSSLILGMVVLICPVFAWYPASGVSVSTTISTKDTPQVTSDSAGGCFTVWVDYRNSNVSTSSDNLTDIYAQKINNDGTLAWGVTGLPICTATSNQTLPQIIPDNAGGAICAWKDARGEIFTQRINSIGSTLWALNGVPVSTTNNYLGTNPPPFQELFFNITSDGNGGVIVVWMDGRNGGMYTSSYNIYAQRINSNGSTLWTNNGLAICTAINGQENPHIISDGIGGAIICWYDDRTGNEQGYAQRVDSTGSTLWQDNGVPTDSGLGDVVTDGAGGAIITWGAGEIDAQRISNLGTVLWGTTGVVIKTVPYVGNGGSYPALASDGNGGAIITWVDSRYTTGIIYAQKVNSSGSTLWVTNGIKISFDSDEFLNQMNTGYGVGAPVILSDNAGGAIITWLDTGQGGTVNYSRLYGQRVDSNGNLLWSTSGVGISGSGYNQQLTTDGAGGVIATWLDPLGGYNNVYVQHVDSQGLESSLTTSLDFTTASDTGLWAYESVPGTNGLPTVSWLSTYGNATGVIELQFSSTNQGVKMTLLKPLWLSSESGQWYEMKVHILTDAPGPNHFTATGILYSGLIPDPANISAQGYFSMPSSDFYLRNYQESIGGELSLFPQLTFKTNDSGGFTIYIDSIEIKPISMPGD